MTNPRPRRLKGVPVDWDELKKRRNLILTDRAWDLLEEKGVALGGVSRSEVLERTVRGLITWADNKEEIHRSLT